MKHISLFSGIGGLDLAAEWAGFRTVAFVERDKYCQRVLRKHWPSVHIFDDIRKLRGLGNLFGEIFILSGGFPCQPHSVAGKRKASLDERDMWGEFARVIGEVKPRWVVAENVPGLLSSESGRFFGRVLRDLVQMGYSPGWGVWGAKDVGALHKRDRVFIVAHATSSRQGRVSEIKREFNHTTAAVHDGEQKFMADSDCKYGEKHIGRNQFSEEIGEATFGWGDSQFGRQWETEPNVGRVADGVPNRVDRLRTLGNAVVPQQAYPLFKAIADYELGLQSLRKGRCYLFRAI